MDILIFVIALSILVLVHEFGHFFAAKITGVRVEEFGLGLPPKIIGKKLWGTVWSLNWLPIGGFCKLYGEDPSASSGRDDEPAHIHEMYGTQPGTTSFANNVLLARKLVEKGVRFVQLFDWGWDSHGTDIKNAVDIGLVNKCRSIDKPITALLLDLKQRGLLDETLVVWGGEFGRTPMQENRDGKTLPFKGRDHHTEAFTTWMAGGGIKQGTSFGETDEIGYSAISGKVTAYDMQATILNQLGFDHEKLTYNSQGRPFRLTDVQGRVITEIIA
jgi:hypothetical protein